MSASEDFYFALYKFTDDDDYYWGCWSQCSACYVLVGNSQQAAVCTSTYLLFRPNDETMLRNQDYYLTNSDASSSDFTPRQVMTVLINELIVINVCKGERLVYSTDAVVLFCDMWHVLTLSPPIPLRLYTLPYWSIFWHVRCGAQDWAPERTSVKNEKWWVRLVWRWTLRTAAIWNIWHWQG